MKLTTEQKSKLEEKLSERFALPKELFGENVGIDMNDFDMHGYIYFLDNVKSLVNLREGLEHLSPLADDALAIAEKMSERDFLRFKKALVHERKAYESDLYYSRMPRKYQPIVIPQRFFYAIMMAEEFKTPLGVVLIRIAELEDELNFSLMETGGF